MTTANQKEKADLFERMNQGAEAQSGIYPMDNFYGKPPNGDADPYNRRVIRALDDIDFEEDSDEAEEIANLNRLPRTILNVENLKKYASDLTIRLNLENHYWLKNNFIDKLGKMCPNLQQLSLRRMK